jgi:hypothetical protein
VQVAGYGWLSQLTVNIVLPGTIAPVTASVHAEHRPAMAKHPEEIIALWQREEAPALRTNGSLVVVRHHGAKVALDVHLGGHVVHIAHWAT